MLDQCCTAREGCSMILVIGHWTPGLSRLARHTVSLHLGRGVYVHAQK